MAKKSTKTNTKKTAVKKKKPALKKPKVAVKKSPFKSKLGHDPLSWITGEDASEFGLSFDDIEAKVGVSTKLAADDAADESTTGLPYTTSESEPEPVSEPVEKAVDTNDGWGLFDDEPVITETVAETPDDSSWGLFDSEETTKESLPVGEGIAWGLFEEEAADDASIDAEALTISLPVTFNVASISKLYHDFEEVIYKSLDVVVDASEVETIDATGLQLLYAAQKELQKHGSKLVVKDASEKIELLSTSSFINNVLDIAS